MRITEFVIYHVRIPLRKPVRHASHARSDTESLVVRCRLDNGTFGWGEGLPREYVTGESIDDAWTLLQATDFSKQLAAPFTDLPEAIVLLDRFQLTRPTVDDRDCFGNSVRCALELSVLDAVCRSLQQPLSSVTPLLPETAPIRAQHERVR